MKTTNQLSAHSFTTISGTYRCTHTHAHHIIQSNVMIIIKKKRILYLKCINGDPNSKCLSVDEWNLQINLLLPVSLIRYRIYNNMSDNINERIYLLMGYSMVTACVYHIDALYKNHPNVFLLLWLLYFCNND